MNDEARRSANPALLARFESCPDGSHLSASEVTDALDEARAERDSQLMAATAVAESP